MQHVIEPPVPYLGLVQRSIALLLPILRVIVALSSAPVAIEGGHA